MAYRELRSTLEKDIIMQQHGFTRRARKKRQTNFVELCAVFSQKAVREGWGKIDLAAIWECSMGNEKSLDKNFSWFKNSPWLILSPRSWSLFRVELFIVQLKDLVSYTDICFFWTVLTIYNSITIISMGRCA